MSLVSSLLRISLLCLFVAGCASSAMKQRREQRDKIIQSAKLYCKFINGETYQDIDIALNIEMGRRCDADKNFSISAYKTPSEIQGIMYCCTVKEEAKDKSFKKETVNIDEVKTPPPALAPNQDKSGDAKK